MAHCKNCGKELQLPFRCNYCDESFCAEHRLPESHNCYGKSVSSPLNIYPKHHVESKPRKIGTCPRCHQPNNRMAKYNAKIMIFRCGQCGLKYGQKKLFPNKYVRVRRRPRPIEPTCKPAPYKPYRKSKSHLKAGLLVSLLLIVVFAGVYLFFLNPNSLQGTPLQSIPSSISNILPVVQQPTHEELVIYMLSLINTDRQSAGLQNVTLSSIDSGQQHADNC